MKRGLFGQTFGFYGLLNHTINITSYSLPSHVLCFSFNRTFQPKVDCAYNLISRGPLIHPHAFVRVCARITRKYVSTTE